MPTRNRNIFGFAIFAIALGVVFAPKPRLDLAVGKPSS